VKNAILNAHIHADFMTPNAAMSGEPKASPLDGTVMHQTEKKDD